MNSLFNPARPLVMHIDLNSCFATVEQQARPLLRGRPVAVLNRNTPGTAIITASYEAKAYGVSTGMKFRDAARLCPGLIGIETDPPKYRYVYHQLLRIMSDYSPDVSMKSVDEGVIQFAKVQLQGRSLQEIGYEIKQRLRSEVGCMMRCNVGIGPNRWWAKMAAGLHKPDGLDVVTADNARSVLSTLQLTDLTGIAAANERRLQAVGIDTPLQMYAASSAALRVAFGGVVGDQWYERLRGYEVDDRPDEVKTCGRQYVLEQRNMSRQQVAARLHNLAEAVGGKLRSQGKAARGVGVYVRLMNTDAQLSTTNGRWGKKGDYWHQKYLAAAPFFSDAAIWRIAERLFAQSPSGDVREIGVHCYHLHGDLGDQLSLFGDELAREQRVTWAVDDINHRYGARTIHAASTLDTDVIRTKIPFGSTRYL